MTVRLRRLSCRSSLDSKSGDALVIGRIGAASELGISPQNVSEERLMQGAHSTHSHHSFAKTASSDS